ncbi:MAG: nucleotidyltransferase domain-containing protein [Exiguobacterium chiriqhucha]|uniref:nucleotidyltransferase domain-containing protein n=1 Tax=Exiguobacterium chiriqhucha TaxID=1385984 RepID=UPI00144C5F2E|nr:nucleotidyltransferase domain-containing protein [Exiguobacterium chiriqhucha]KAB2864814.1 MAG: nucleotidyltransferase domain-containing protein [Exiguobacterium chiriqhucha]
MPSKIDPLEAAHHFISTHFPYCQAALLAGSVVRGEATETSDLDIIIFDATLVSSYRESFIESGWPIELFAHNLTSYRTFFEQDCQRAIPSLPRMVTEGIVLKDTDIVEDIKREARALLDSGPEAWSDETIEMKRYFLTDALEDLIGCTTRAEGLFIAGALATLVCEFILRTNRQWTGSAKWMYRALERYDAQAARELVTALETYYQTNETDALIRYVDETLTPFGGRLFAGFSRAKSNET